MPPAGRHAAALGACKLMFMAWPNGLVQPEALKAMLSTSAVTVTCDLRPRGAREQQDVGSAARCGEVDVPAGPVAIEANRRVATDGFAARLLDAAAHVFGDAADIGVGEMAAHAGQGERREQPDDHHHHEQLDQREARGFLR